MKMGYNTQVISMWLIIIVMGLLLLSISNCSDPTSRSYDILVDPMLTQDANGYFHMTLDGNRWQTFHRFTGSVSYDGEPVDCMRVEWESDFYWVLNDTIGYVATYAYTDDLVYMAIDTSYIYFGQEVFRVPIINSVSLSNADGEFNTMFAPVLTQRGDTVAVTMTIWDEHINFNVVLD